MQSEGTYLTLGQADDSQTVFDGEYIIYYKSGKVAQKGARVNSQSEGDCTIYYENGLVKQNIPYKGGKVSGILTQFTEDGKQCTQVEYKDGEPLHDYYVMSNQQGYSCKFRLSDNKPITESPDPSEMQRQHKDGATWLYCVKTGLMVAASNTQVKDSGNTTASMSS